MADICSNKVLFLGLETYGRFGGIQRFNQRLIDALIHCTGPEGLCALFTADKQSDIPADLPKSVRGFAGKKIAFLAAAGKAALSCDTLILGHINLLPFGVAMKRLRPKMRLIMMAHGVEVWNDPAFRQARSYEPKLLKQVDTIATVSAYTKSVMMREFDLQEAQFQLFPNTVDAQVDVQHTPSAPAFALAVSRMDVHDQTKHLDQIIRAMAQLPESLSHTKLIIVGDGVLRPTYEALAQAEGVAERVEFAGRVSNERLLELYQNATQFVLPSSKEGFGIVYLEAWSHLLPVICSIHGAAPEVVTDGRDGFALDPMDTNALAHAMQQLFETPDLAAKMARNGADKMLKLYTTDVLNTNTAYLIAAPEHG